MFKYLPFAAWVLWAGCATVPDDEDKGEKTVLPSFYSLKEGERLDHKMPLPNLTKILVNWTYSDGGQTSKEGFRGWDVDHDGRFDMLEVLDSAGKPYMWAYDFDGDGVIDAVDEDKKGIVSTRRHTEAEMDDEADGY